MATVGVDLGGTKIAAGVLADGRVRARTVRPTPKEGGLAVVEAMAACVRAAIQESGLSGVKAVGVGSPGPLDFERGRVRFAPNIPNLTDFPLREALAEAVGLPVVLENDANAAALAEHHLGAAKDAQSSVYVTVSTGIGGGVVFGDRVWRGAFGQGGEVGHFVVLPHGPVCGCGQSGCLEALASGVAIARDARYAYKREMDTPEVFARWRKGEPKARRIVEQAADYLGLGLASLQRVLDPEVFVLGGGVVLGGGAAYLELVQAAFARYTEGWRAGALRVAALGKEAGWIGAALAAELSG
ncbi:ROK family protein [Marinithermus hydrothermalis]|uniref:N-acylmannosamine kinase n=1 Tax=Marinithermus hydrothermalis (strain DSM 14884 / JCM 11576 / T1) TaxID=869210 RepID=F2NPM4_MARHT|nr:ROK family protein [Marinithermus hydrothermalis]AEB12525.1 N-acylmannosamine kinase [Marinithermus hydrothermalis DSM 14884]